MSSEPKANFNSFYKYIYYRNTYEKKLCPDKPWLITYLLNTRFNPNSSYNIHIKSWLKDKYENKLKNDFNKNIKTWEIDIKDKYLYSSLNKDVNVIPSNIPIIINLQSINIAKANIEVCELNLDWYLDYANNKVVNFKMNFANSKKCRFKK